MMLYVFHVEVGRMMSFDMTVALSSVENLKDTIERLHNIPQANIVLLVSGGDMLTETTQVSCYSAGTDTNPIYMFLTGDFKLPATLSQNDGEIDLRQQVERCLELPAVYETVATRAQLALRMYDLARDEERVCERLVHEQHLQQQGWSAVIANLEDLAKEFRLRFENFCVAFDRHLEKRETDLELLRNFNGDLTQLSRIPILPGLMPLAEADFHGFDEFLDTDEVFSNAQQTSVIAAGGAVPQEDDDENAGDDKSTSTSPNKKQKMANDASLETAELGAAAMKSSTASNSSARRPNLNLLQWITSKENHNVLKVMSEECVQGLSTFNEAVYVQLKTEVLNIIKLAEQNDVKEIKGLGERLRRLDEFTYKIKSMVQDQKELSTAFQQNQNRAINLRDPSILPDLCDSHQSQLRVMLQNQVKIREHKRCIAKAKDELGDNLNKRLKRIVVIENAMSDFDTRLLFYNRCLRRAERHINIIEQIHQAPSIYVAAVTEVVRRKIFSTEFRQWASKLAEDFDSIHSEEITRRERFNRSFEGHFLNILFPGMHDMPPMFANDNPLIFDARLPNLTRSDIEMLTSHLPDLAPQFQLPDMAPVINFFVSRSGQHQLERMEELLKQQVAAAFGEKRLQHQRLTELQKVGTAGAIGGIDESETDTETEFEKVSASPQHVATSTSEIAQPDTMARSTATECILMQSAETLTDDNETNTRDEVARLQSALNAMSELAVNCIRMARTNLDSFRTYTVSHREDLQSELQSLSDKWNVICMEYGGHEQQLQKQCAEREEELKLLHETLLARDNELTLLRRQADEMQAKHDAVTAQLEELRLLLEAVQQDKQAAVAKAREELIHEHKTEIESLRCRFKLMTSMEQRSPTDTSLENLERATATSCEQMPANVIERSAHEAMLAQMRANFHAERERAVQAAVDYERTIWLTKMHPLNNDSVMGNLGILKSMLEDRERQLEQMRDRDRILTADNFQLRTRLDALTDEDGNSWQREKIEYLHKDRTRLEEELRLEKLRRMEMETSVAALKTSVYELPRSKSSGSSHKFVVLESCTKGDIVFVVWSMRHGQFVVVQDSSSLYFVHGDSLPGLKLQLPIVVDGDSDCESYIPRPFYAVGRVIDKEYCQARKDENRYRVTRGSKFYRIKLSPLPMRQATYRERLESFSTSTSRSISQCESQSESTITLRGSTSSSAVTTAATDAVDSADKAKTKSATHKIVPTGIKERTISITSVTEEDDEPMSLVSEHCGYISEENEPQQTEVGSADEHVTQMLATTNNTLQQQQEQSVITEQPTASSANKLQMDLLLATADITQSIATIAPTIAVTADIVAADMAEAEEEQQEPISIDIDADAQSTADATTAAAEEHSAKAAENTDNHSACSASVPTCTASEDSDEYRSLDAKDDTDFPIV